MERNEAQKRVFQLVFSEKKHFGEALSLLPGCGGVQMRT